MGNFHVRSMCEPSSKPNHSFLFLNLFYFIFFVRKTILYILFANGFDLKRANLSFFFRINTNINWNNKRETKNANTIVYLLQEYHHQSINEDGIWGDTEFDNFLGLAGAEHWTLKNLWNNMMLRSFYTFICVFHWLIGGLLPGQTSDGSTPTSCTRWKSRTSCARWTTKTWQFVRILNK